MMTEKLRVNYTKACREETKRNINDMVHNFVDNDNMDKDYKDKIIHMIVELLTLK